MLLKNTISKLKENKIKFVLMAGWKNKEQVNIKGLALKRVLKRSLKLKIFGR